MKSKTKEARAAYWQKWAAINCPPVSRSCMKLCVPCHKKTDTYGWANYHKAIIAKRMGQEVLAFA